MRVAMAAVRAARGTMRKLGVGPAGDVGTAHDLDDVRERRRVVARARLEARSGSSARPSTSMATPAGVVGDLAGRGRGARASR
ncbi:MAG: hypothetical protein MZV70_06775 [Desulfobacterales bacterium]|nr:hypothetical protein [Desulfobacterales bacterium]